jgi:hypothetical protein
VRARAVHAFRFVGTLEQTVHFSRSILTGDENMGRGLLLWLIGIPLPIILLIWLFGGLH